MVGVRCTRGARENARAEVNLMYAAGGAQATGLQLVHAPLVSLKHTLRCSQLSLKRFVLLSQRAVIGRLRGLWTSRGLHRGLRALHWRGYSHRGLQCDQNGKAVARVSVRSNNVQSFDLLL